jgi:hypothetical protein
MRDELLEVKCEPVRRRFGNFNPHGLLTCHVRAALADRRWHTICSMLPVAKQHVSPMVASHRFVDQASKDPRRRKEREAQLLSVPFDEQVIGGWIVMLQDAVHHVVERGQAVRRGRGNLGEVRLTKWFCCYCGKPTTKRILSCRTCRSKSARRAYCASCGGKLDTQEEFCAVCASIIDGSG